MDEKKVILKLLAEIIEIMTGEPAKQSWPPRKGAPRNGSALAMLSLILGILLGVIAALVLKGCAVFDASILGP